MIVNRTKRTALIDKDLPFNGKGLIYIDFNSKSLKLLTKYEDWKPLCISDNSELVILASQWISYRGSNRTELIVLDIETEEEVFYTKDYLVYDAVFDNSNTKLLLDVYNKKPVSIDIKTSEKAELPKKDIRIYKGTFTPLENKFYLPSVTKKRCVYAFSFDTGKTDEVILKIDDDVSKIKFLSKKNTYIVYSTNDVMYSFSSDLKVINWEIDFKELDDIPTFVSSTVLSSEDEDLIFTTASSTVNNTWGVDYCISLKDGEIVKYLENKEGRGRISEHFFDNEVLLYNGNTMDMLTGKIRTPEEMTSISDILYN